MYYVHNICLSSHPIPLHVLHVFLHSGLPLAAVLTKVIHTITRLPTHVTILHVAMSTVNPIIPCSLLVDLVILITINNY